MVDDKKDINGMDTVSELDTIVVDDFSDLVQTRQGTDRKEAQPTISNLGTIIDRFGTIGDLQETVAAGYLGTVVQKVRRTSLKTLMLLGIGGVVVGVLISVVALKLIYPALKRERVVERPPIVSSENENAVEEMEPLEIELIDNEQQNKISQEPVFDELPSVENVEETLKEASLEMRQETERKPSDIVEYASGREVNTGKGEAAFLSGTQRTYGPGAMKPKGKINIKASKGMTGQDMHLYSTGKEGRYRNQKGDLEWQGGFAVDKPEKNIKLGSAYSEYLKNNLGNGATDSLVVIEKRKSKALKNSVSTTQVEGSMKSYPE